MKGFMVSDILEPKKSSSKSASATNTCPSTPSKTNSRTAPPHSDEPPNKKKSSKTLISKNYSMCSRVRKREIDINSSFIKHEKHDLTNVFICE